MTSKLRNSVTLVIASLFFIGISAAKADIIANPTPSSVNIALGQPTAITITWTVASTSCTGTGTVSSPNGILLVGASQVGTAGTSLSRAVIGTGPAVQISETVLIPQSVAVQAMQAASSATFRRVWTTSIPCTSTTTTANVAMPVVSTSASGFNVSRLALSFDGGAPTRIVGRKDSLRANAEINFNGNGMLQGVWEIAGPTSTAGEPTYRPLATVRQFLIGSDRQILQSPALPTENAGLHLIRLRITDPAIAFDTPVIRYFVADERTGARVPAISLSLLTPPNQSLIAPDTAFAWDIIRGARAYQLELYEKPRSAGDTLPDLGGAMETAPPSLPPTPPVTGMLVPGAQTRTTLSAAARAHLVSGQIYLWRVLAIGGDGTVVGESPLRELRMP